MPRKNFYSIAKLANMKKLFSINAIGLIFLALLMLNLLACQKETTVSSANQKQESVSPDTQLAQAAITSNVNLKFPIGISLFIPCANGGAGEMVDVSGDLHQLVTLVVNGNHFHIKMQFQPQGLSGLGEITRDKYQATGGTQVVQDGTFLNGQYAETDVNNFRFIGQGTGNNFLEHDVFHVTFDADGIITSNHVSSSFDCK